MALSGDTGLHVLLIPLAYVVLFQCDSLGTLNCVHGFPGPAVISVDQGCIRGCTPVCEQACVSPLVSVF